MPSAPLSVTGSSSFLTTEDRPRPMWLRQAVDEANHKLGRGTVRVHGASLKPNWELHSAHRAGPLAGTKHHR